jgi:hypothetical protein
METEKSSLVDLQSINDFSSANSGQDHLQYSRNKNSMLKIAGIILIIAGIIIIMHWVYIMISPDFTDMLMNTGVYDNMNITSEELSTVFNFCGILCIGLSLFTIIGGIVALQRRMFWLAFIGGIVGIFAISPLFFFIPNILSLVGTLLMFRARKDFNNMSLT